MQLADRSTDQTAETIRQYGFPKTIHRHAKTLHRIFTSACTLHST